MDTFVNSTVITTSDELGRELNRNIAEIIEEVEGRISRHIETSEIYILNGLLRTGRHVNFNLTAETANLLNIAQNVQEATNGAFNPILGEIVD
jgi:thiamine biosynthesis lipoprotein ApbE